jgi:hypothetical protein
MFIYLFSFLLISQIANKTVTVPGLALIINAKLITTHVCFEFNFRKNEILQMEAVYAVDEWMRFCGRNCKQIMEWTKKCTYELPSFIFTFIFVHHISFAINN